MEDKEEQQQAVYDILHQAAFNFRKLHLLSHYGTQVRDFGTLPQYSTEITESLQKPLKDTYRRPNRVDAAEQILDTISRDNAFTMRELNLIAWSRDIKVDRDILDMLGNVAVDSQGLVRAKKVAKPPLRHPTLGVKRDADKLSGSPLSFLAEKLGIPCLIAQFKHYFELNMTDSEGILDTKWVSAYRAHYCYALSVPVVQFRGEGEVIHKLRWTGKENFRNIGRPRANWVWVRL